MKQIRWKAIGSGEDWGELENAQLPKGSAAVQFWSMVAMWDYGIRIVQASAFFTRRRKFT